MITTIYGPMEESALEKETGFLDNEIEYTTWVEYWLRGELVHRSATVNLKQGLGLEGVLGQLGR